MPVQIKTSYPGAILFVHLLCINNALYAEEIKSEYIYRSPEERREAGLKTELTEWLTFSGLLEIERERESLIYLDNIPDIKLDDDTEVLQLGFDFTFTKNISGILLFEFEQDEQNNSHTVIEEAALQIESDNAELELGKQTVPFGEYYSHFITDPLLSFGEKLDSNIVITIEASDYVDIAVFASEGKASKPGEKTRDWGTNLELRNEDESLKLAIGYLSDLADTDERLLEEYDNTYQRRVPALNINALMGFESSEITVEYITALDEFVELDKEFNKPSAFNVELAYFPTTDIQIAIRAETSKKLEDAPSRQYGISTTFVFARSMTFSIEYLTGTFKRDSVSDDDDNIFDKTQTLAAQFALTF